MASLGLTQPPETQSTKTDFDFSILCVLCNPAATGGYVCPGHRDAERDNLRAIVDPLFTRTGDATGQPTEDDSPAF